MKEFLGWITKHKKISLLAGVFFIVGVPLIIHILFKMQPKNSFYVAEWSAGELLQYYSSLLTCFSTTLLSLAALRFTINSKEEDDKKKCKINIGIKNEEKVTICCNKCRWWLRMDCMNFSDMLPEYAVVQFFKMAWLDDFSSKVMSEVLKKSFCTITNIAEKEFRVDISFADEADEFSDFLKLEKIKKDFNRGLLTEEEVNRITKKVIELKIGMYSGGIVTPIKITLFLDWNFEIRGNESFGEYTYVIEHSSIYVSSTMSEDDYEKKLRE